MQIKFCFLQWAFILVLGCTNLHAQKLKSKPNFNGHLSAYFHQNGNLPSKGKGTPLEAQLYIYQPTLVSQLDTVMNDHFTRKIASQPVETIKSDGLGYFKTHLKPGKYSLFIQFEGAYYIPYFSGSEWVSLFEVKSKGVTTLDVKVFSKDSYQ